MARQWEAEHTLPSDKALRLIQTQFPELNAKSLRFFGSGWDNTAYLVDETYVFRFPRREIAVSLIETESHILPKIAKKLPLPIPFPEWIGKPTEIFSWPFSGYRLLPGETACQANLSDAERSALAEPLARFLKALHSLPPDSALAGDLIGRLSIPRLLKELEKQLAELAFLGMIEQSLYAPLFAQARHLLPAAETHVVHGDFYVRHLLINEKRQLCGVIDWGDMHLGDPAVDLMIVHSFLPKTAHAAFRELYGPIDDNTWSLAQLRSAYSSSLLAIFGHQIKDEALRREGLYGLKKIAQEITC